MILPKAGILGAGRFGRALALRMRHRCEVAIFDVLTKPTKQFAKQNGLTFLREEDLYSLCDFLVLCVPPSEVEKVVSRLDGMERGVSIVLNTATSVHTPELISKLGIRRIKLIGLKPIAQFTAIDHGVNAVFVTEHHPGADLDFLSDILSDIGVVRYGDEMVVQALNREATRLALQFGADFALAVRSITNDSEWMLSALHNCAAGTILDFPPDPRNVYASALLKDSISTAMHPLCTVKEGR